MILQYQGKSFFPSRIIKWFTWGKYSHSAWSFCEVSDDLLVGDTSEYEAWQKGGTQHVPRIGANHTKGTRIDLYELRKPLTDKEADIVLEFLTKTLHEKYDYRGILGFLLRAKTNNPDAWFCSEWIFAALETAGRIILWGVNAYQVSPSMITMSPELRYVGYIIAGEELIVLQDEPK